MDSKRPQIQSLPRRGRYKGLEWKWKLARYQKNRVNTICCHKMAVHRCWGCVTRAQCSWEWDNHSYTRAMLSELRSFI